jgi:hypothetical protein
MTTAYPSKTTAADTAAGTVTARTVTTHIIDITVDPQHIAGADTEIVLRVNGRPLTRMTSHRAARMGLVDDGHRNW